MGPKWAFVRYSSICNFKFREYSVLYFFLYLVFGSKSNKSDNRIQPEKEQISGKYMHVIRKIYCIVRDVQQRHIQRSAPYLCYKSLAFFPAQCILLNPTLSVTHCIKMWRMLNTAHISTSHSVVLLSFNNLHSPVNVHFRPSITMSAPTWQQVSN